MKRVPVDFSKTNSFPQIFLDYIGHKDSLTPFYKYTPDISSFKKVIEDKSKDVINRPVLVEVLKEQHAGLQSNPKQTENINSLLSDKTFTVTTGHQLSIFTGPLYSIYKILSVIKLARELKKNYPDNSFVPVFWMVTEDHDFEEINHINIFGKKIVWNPAGQQALTGKVPAGGLKCEEMEGLIDEVKGMIGESENSAYLINLFRAAYSEQNTLAEATRIIMNALFGKYGLVVLDASDKRLKNVFKDIMKEELQQSSSCKNVVDTITKFELLGYKAQVNPREINLFYLGEGKRNRIVKEEGGYAVLDAAKKFTEAEIFSELESHPERFSPNVVLRPLYQEKILPNLAYVGGPGETSYWLEYRRMFEYFKVNYPVLAIRNCAMWLDQGASSRMDKLSVSAEEIFLETESLVKVFFDKKFDHAFSLDDEAKQIENVFATLVDKAAAVDVTLKSSVEAEKQKQLSGLKHIEDKMIRAQKKKHETAISQVRKLKEKLFPEGSLQERYENFIPYYAKHGEKYFDMLLDNFDALPQKFLVLSEEE
jgi:bacillithiol synthase